MPDDFYECCIGLPSAQEAGPKTVSLKNAEINERKAPGSIA
jgi:hypothetical protein